MGSTVTSSPVHSKSTLVGQSPAWVVWVWVVAPVSMVLSTRAVYLRNTTLGTMLVELDGPMTTSYLSLKSPSHGLNQYPKSIMVTTVRTLPVLSSSINLSLSH